MMKKIISAVTALLIVASPGTYGTITQSVSPTKITASASGNLKYGNMTYSVETDENGEEYIVITYCSGGSKVTEVDIPEEIDGIPVRVIGDSAFSNCTYLKSVTIPSTVTTIEKLAFKSSGLKSVDIPGSVKTIGNSAFSYCMGLEELTLNDGLTEIGNYAFNDCYKLEEVKFPSTVTSTGEAAFSDCKALTTIIFGENMDHIERAAFHSCKALTSIEIPATIKYIDESAFWGCEALETLVFNEGLETLSYGSFGNCRALTSVTVPGSVKTIEYGVFRTCTGLEKVVISEGVQEIGEEAFYQCSNLKDLTLPESLTAIGEEAFRYCKNLEKVTIPANLEKIDAYAFAGCEVLSDITFEDGLTFTGNYMFHNCPALTSVEFPESVTKIGNRSFQKCSGLETVTLPSDLTDIDDYAFNECTSLKEIVIPASVSYIGNSAFMECTSLENVIFEESDVEMKIGSQAFCRCHALSYFIFPGNVAEIGPTLLTHCDNLKAVIVESGSLKTAPQVNGTPIEYMGLPKNIKSISQYVFMDCENLTDIYYEGSEEEWESVIKYAKDDDPLYSATIHFNSTAPDPRGEAGGTTTTPEVTTSTSSTTESTTSTTATTTEETSTTTEATTTEEASTTTEATTTSKAVETKATGAYVTVTDGTSAAATTTVVNTEVGNEYTVGTYGSLTYKKYINRVEIAKCDESAEGTIEVPGDIEGLPVNMIGLSAFYGCDKVTEIKLPDTVTVIREGAFEDCSGLTSITLSANLVSIRSNAFRGCSSLISAVIPESTKNVDDYAFCECKSLKEITFLRPDCVISDRLVTSSDDYALSTIRGYENSTAQEFAEKFGYEFVSIETPDVTTAASTTTTGSTENVTTATVTTVIGYPSAVGTYEDMKYEIYSDCIVITSCSRAAEGEIVIPEKIDGLPVIKIDYEAFAHCENITKITVPKSVDIISSYAFGFCTKLAEIEILNPDCLIADSYHTISNGLDENGKVYYDGIIRGYTGSTAQIYAERCEYTFESLGDAPVTLGDVDGNGTIDSADATVVLVAYALIQTGQDSGLTPEQEKAADVDRNGSINSADASKILAYYADISTGKTPSWDDDTSEETPEFSDWKSAYKATVDAVIAEWGENKEDIAVMMPFVDNDDVPELCVVSSDGKHITYTFYDGTLREIIRGSAKTENAPTSYGEKTGYLELISYDSIFYIELKLCILENGILNVIHELVQQIDEEDYTRTYTVDGEVVTEEEFDAVYEPWTKAEQGNAEALTYDEAIEYIDSL